MRAGILEEILLDYLHKIPRDSNTGTKAVLGYNFYHTVTEGLVFLCVTSSAEDIDVARRFLTELSSNINVHIIKNTSKRTEILTKLLTKLVNRYNETSDKLKSIESSLLHTTDTLRGNISSILERGELIDSIVTKSNNLRDETLNFRDSLKNSNSSFIVRYFSNLIRNRIAYIALSMRNFRKFLIDLIIKSSGKEKLTHSLIPALLIGGLFGSNLTLSQMLPDGTNQKHNVILYTLLGIAIGALIYYLYNNYYSVFATKYENYFRHKKNDREKNN